MLRKLRSDNLNKRKLNTVVKQSSVHGKGLFAARDFAAGEIVEVMIGYIQGELEIPSKSKYSIMLRGGKRILVLTNKTRYINHSAQPNVRLSLRKDCVIALKDIHSGEELTCRYDSVFG
jgi:SET domain-containing protein